MPWYDKDGSRITFDQACALLGDGEPAEPVVQVDAARTTPTFHLCYCVIVHDGEPEESGRCHAFGLGPDEPFCPECEDRHPEMQLRLGITVTTWAVRP